MDVLNFAITNGMTTIPNPQYNPKSKKNTVPPTITVPDIAVKGNPVLDFATKDLFNQYTIDAKTSDTYRKYGINWNPTEAATDSLDRQRADAQSNWEKLRNAIGQTLISEIGLGTVKAFFDMVDAGGQIFGLTERDYTNPISAKLEEWQNAYNDARAIYARPGSDIFNGGFSDFGWLMQNVPSIASSLTLLIPSNLVLRGLSALGKVAKTAAKTAGKAAKASKVGTAVRGSKTAAKWSARTSKLSDVAAARKVYDFAFSPTTRAVLKGGAETILNAGLMRTIENYQEAHQVYDDMYSQAFTALDKMSDEEYANFLKRNENSLEGVDTSNKNEVAKALARTSADTTFQWDFANTLFDVIQLGALRNLPFKGVKKGLFDTPSASVRRAHLNSIKLAGAKSATEAEQKLAERTFRAKLKQKVGDKLYSLGTVGVAELSEGVEEAVNYIAQQEGMNVGHVMLGMAANSTFNDRLNSYMKEAGLWESAFWGVVGGVVFEGLGSQYHRGMNAVDAKRSERERSKLQNDKTKEKVDKPGWSELWETAENKRRIADINARYSDYAKLNQQLDMIENRNLNPFEIDESGNNKPITSAEKEVLKEKALNDFVTQTTLRSLDAGNYELLEEYMKSDELRKALVDGGYLSEAEAAAHQQNVTAQMDRIVKIYNNNVRALAKTAARINDKFDDEIPLDYLQLIARQNIDRQLTIEDLQKQLNAWEAESEEQRAFFEDKLEKGIDYKSGVRSVFLAQQLGILEAEKRELQNNPAVANSVMGQFEIETLDRKISTIRDMIYDLEPKNGVSNLLFAIQNSKAFEKYGDRYYANWGNEEYTKFSNMLYDLEQGGFDSKGVTLNEDARKYFESIDKRLTTVKLEDINKKNKADYELLGYRTLEDKAADLAESYSKIAELQTRIALERSEIALSETEVTNEVNRLHNILNEARQEAVRNAADTIVGLADTYGSENIRKALLERYNSNEVKDDYFGNTEEDKQRGKVFNDAVDILHLDSAANKELYAIVDDMLRQHDDVVAAQSQNYSTSENSISGDNTQSVVNPTQPTQQSNTQQNTQQNQPITPTNNQQTQTPSNNNQQVITYGNGRSAIVDNTTGNISLQDEGKTYAVLQPIPNQQGQYGLQVMSNEPEGVNLLHNDDYYNKNGVSLTDDYYIKEKPVVSFDIKSGNISPLKKGEIARTAVVEEENGGEISEEPQNFSTGDENQTPIANDDSYVPTSEPEQAVVDDPTSIMAAQPKEHFVRDDSTLAAELAARNADDVLSGNVHDTVMNIIRSAGQNNTEIDWNALRTQLINQYVNPAQDKDAAKLIVDGTIKWGQKFAKRKNVKQTLIIDAAAKASAITEQTKNNKELVKEFQDAVDKLVEKYKEDVAADYIDGKYYVRLEDLLRYCNEGAESNAISMILYNKLLEYMKNSDKFILIDKGSVQEALDNANKSLEIRRAQMQVADNMFGIGFDSYAGMLASKDLKHELQKVYDAIDTLEAGSKIKYRLQGGAIQFVINDTVVGVLPMPKTASDGSRWQYNDGWMTDVLRNTDGTIQSKLKDLLTSWLSDTTNEDVKSVIDMALKARFGNLKNSELRMLAYTFGNNPEIVKAKQDGFIDPKADDVTALVGLGKLIGYTRQFSGLSVEETNQIRIDTLNTWFNDNVATSFDAIEAMAAKGDSTVEVGYVNEGELIITDRKDALPASQAIGEKHKDTARLAFSNNVGNLVLAKGGIDGNTQLSFAGIQGAVVKGSTMVVIPAKSGRHGYVQAYPQPISSDSVGKVGKQIVNAVIEEIERITKNPSKEGVEELQTFLAKLINLNNNSALFKLRFMGRGVLSEYNSQTKEKIGFSIQYNSDNFRNANGQSVNHKLAIKSNNGIGFTIKLDNKEEEAVTSEELVKYLKDNILSLCNFNIAPNFVHSDNDTSLPMSGLAHRNEKGQFVIHISDKHEFTFDSFNDFILDNDIVRLTTRPAENGTNYSRTTTNNNQLAKPIIKVKLDTEVTTPVEESKTGQPKTTKTTAEQVLDILNTPKKVNQVGSQIAKVILGDKFKNLKINSKVFDLFPNDIIFVDKELGANAYSNPTNSNTTVGKNKEITLKPGQVVIGREWLNMLNGSVTNKQEAVRKLIHERLHLVLHSDGNSHFVEQIRTIFDEFYAKSTNTKLDVYKYDNTKENTDKYWTDGKLNEKGLEEFLVESLTSKELAEELNSIQTDEVVNGKNTKQSLFQKIMKFLSDLFGWGIEKGSLYEKEFMLLSDIMSDNSQNETQTTDSNTQSQTEINFDEPISTEQIVEDNATDNVLNSADVTFDDELGDAFSSSITETEDSASIATFVDKFPINQQASIRSKIDKGEIQISCK